MHRAQHTRRTAGVAALLPALFLAALYVAAPFAGTTTHAIARQTGQPAVVQAAAPDLGAHPSRLIGTPVDVAAPASALHTMAFWYGAVIAVAVVLLVAIAVGHAVGAFRHRHRHSG